MEPRYMPIGIQDFAKVRTGGCVYVDKTAWVYRLTRTECPYFLGRPRRFGKSLLVSTLKYYFEGRRDLFDGTAGRAPLAIDALETEWTPHPVFHLDLNNSGCDSVADLKTGLGSLLYVFEKRWGSPTAEEAASLPSRFTSLIRRAVEQSGQKVVVLIDEYDRPLVQTMDDDSLHEEIRAFLKGFYGVLKGADQWLRFVFLTGVTKFSRVSVFSDLNQLIDISMDKDYANICGITETELIDNFGPEIQSLADAQGMTFNKALAEMRKRYNGYCFAPNTDRVYNPFSVINTFKIQRFGYYWFRTGTPSVLIAQLKNARLDIPSFTGGVSILSQDIDDYRAQGDNPVPLLYQSGYLTIKDYDAAFDLYTLGFPNEEVKYAFLEELLASYRVKTPDQNGLASRNFTRDLYHIKINDFVVRLRSLIATIPYDMKAEETEHYFQTVVFMLFTLMGQFVQAEVHSHKGRCDAVVIVPDAVYVFEFKIFSSNSNATDTANSDVIAINGNAAGGKAAEDALEQIDAKDYMAPYRASGKRRIKIGAAYDTAKRELGPVTAREE